MQSQGHKRVVITDSHQGMLSTAGLLLDAEDDICVVGQATDLASATSLAAEMEADVLILDLHMLDGATRSTIHELRRRLPTTEIVILTMEATPAYVAVVREAGALGYVLKEFADGELAEAVREAAVGHPFVSEKLAA